MDTAAPSSGLDPSSQAGHQCNSDTTPASSPDSVSSSSFSSECASQHQEAHPLDPYQLPYDLPACTLGPGSPVPQQLQLPVETPSYAQAHVQATLRMFSAHEQGRFDATEEQDRPAKAGQLRATSEELRQFGTYLSSLRLPPRTASSSRATPDTSSPADSACRHRAQRASERQAMRTSGDTRAESATERLLEKRKRQQPVDISSSSSSSVSSSASSSATPLSSSVHHGAPPLRQAASIANSSASCSCSSSTSASASFASFSSAQPASWPTALASSTLYCDAPSPACAVHASSAIRRPTLGTQPPFVTSNASVSSTSSALNAALVYPPAKRLRPSFQSSDVIEPSSLQRQELLGEGAFGRVYRGLLHGSTVVAVKELKLVHVRSTNTFFGNEEDFLHEISVLKALHHPNVILFIGYTQTPTLSMVTEFMDMGSLYDLLHNLHVRLSAHKILHVARSVGRGLIHLHAQTPPILHKDLKSSNVLVSNNWNSIKLSDFGLATTKSAAAAGLCGDVAWRAPETYVSEFTEKSDVYSYGMLVWELVARQKPYAGLNHKQKMRAVREGLRPVLPRNCPLSGLISACWNPDPEKRPALSDVLTELQQLGPEFTTNSDSVLTKSQCTESTDGGIEFGLSSEPDPMRVRDVVDVDNAETLLKSLPKHVQHARLSTFLFRTNCMEEALNKLQEDIVPFLNKRGSVLVLHSNYWCKTLCLLCYKDRHELVGASPAGGGTHGEMVHLQPYEQPNYGDDESASTTPDTLYTGTPEKAQTISVSAPTGQPVDDMGSTHTASGETPSCSSSSSSAATSSTSTSTSTSSSSTSSSLLPSILACSGSLPNEQAAQQRTTLPSGAATTADLDSRNAPTHPSAEALAVLERAMVIPAVTEVLEAVVFGVRPELAKKAIAVHIRIKPGTNTMAMDHWKRSIIPHLAAIPYWCGSLVITDYHVGRVLMLGLLADDEGRRTFETTAYHQILDQSMGRYLAGVPIVEHYDVSCIRPEIS
eukprot:CAMPEP_0177642190 /NCGR_PEP_ID=MMETSP0447-20121125/7455_1 /TAXON_ID=0 /ORGANISM="Stygamoeba regulata, Strain BSH-02190019" /LENGTH=994 /DNA_ID=CAMNT_0019144333 /DNA_START=143 /DNA_END=3127 /DNA_ORIENTATION=+